MSKVDKIKKLIVSKGLTPYAISKGSKVSEATLSRILSGKTKKPNASTLASIVAFLESYNPHENAIMDDNPIKTSYEIPVKEEGVPYFDIDFTSSFLEIINNQQTKPNYYVNHPFFKDCDFIVRASGQSMSKVIKHGDAIGLVKIEGWQEFLPMGEIYAIVTNNGFRMIKIITQGETKDSFTLLSKPTDNKKDEFPPQQIKIETILSIYKVQASSHLF